MKYQPEPIGIDELVVNWHVLEACNYRCRYCYAHWEKEDKYEIWRSDQWGPFLEALWAFFDPSNTDNPLRKLMTWNTVRLSLAGGEPTLLGTRLIDIARKAHGLGFKVSLISNGSGLTSYTLVELVPFLSVLGLSVDSEDPKTNEAIGRTERGVSLPASKIKSIVANTREINPSITIKINTVVNDMNVNLDFHSFIESVRPDRWKVMRMLPITTHDLAISDDEYQAFLKRHTSLKHLMNQEGNESMRQSYIMLDPLGRFFQNTPGDSQYLYSGKILQVGADVAFQQIPFSPSKFASRYEVQE